MAVRRLHESNLNALPPADVEVEQQVLGTILSRPETFDQVSAILEPEHFFEPVHRRIYEVAGSLIASGKFAGLQAIRQHIPADFKVGDMDRNAYLARLAAVSAPVTMLGGLSQLIRDYALRRQLFGIGEDIASLALNASPEESASKQIEAAESLLAGLRTGYRASSSSLSLTGALNASADALATAYRDQKLSGLPWALPEIEDTLDTRIESGGLYGLLGASQEGKTTLTLQILRHLAESGVPVIFLSSEQTEEQCIFQMHQQKLGIPSRRLKEGRFSDDEYLAVMADKKALAALPFAIQTWGEKTVGELAIRVRAFFRRWGPGLFAVDHAKNILADYRNDILAMQVSQIFRGLKTLAMDERASGLVLMQRNSGDQPGRKVMRPVRRDCYGGEGTLQNLDACLALYRAEIWIEERLRLCDNEKERADLGLKLNASRDRAEFYNLKSRFGARNGRKIVEFDGPHTRFMSLRPQESEALPF